MMKHLSITALTCSALLALTNQVNAEGFKVGDVEFELNCGLPRPESFVLEQNIYKFRLVNEDVGKCSTDNKSFTSNTYHKDFSERSEIIINSPKLYKNKIYKIKFKHRIQSGYDNGDRNETFFQMKNCGDSRVPVMAFLRMDARSHKRYAFSLSAGTKHNQFVFGNDSANLRKKEWYNYEITYNTSEKSWIEVLVNGKIVLPKTTFENVGYCDAFDTLRIGNYRSGADTGVGKINTTSISEYKDITISKID
jgi:hypothetical protein